MKRTSAERTTRRMPLSVAKSNVDGSATMPDGSYPEGASVDAISDSSAMNGFSTHGAADERMEMSAGIDERRDHDEHRLHARIAERAYELYRSRNGSDGDPVSDWLQAEAEVTGEQR